MISDILSSECIEMKDPYLSRVSKASYVVGRKMTYARVFHPKLN